MFTRRTFLASSASLAASPGLPVPVWAATPANTLVIHDEAYANFLPANERFPKAALDPRMLRLRTFSKEYGLAGLRVGYALGVPDAIAAISSAEFLLLFASLSNTCR